MIGKTILHYRIEEELGSGGMAVVYKARDMKLDRFVALKFLSDHLNQSEEGKKRFIGEAKAASALDHSNICTIHEIGAAEDGRMFIAMAHYEGETLQQKIDSGPLSPDEAIDIATQIAEGLSKAHGKDIVHRDLKPANVVITTDGIAKILDFGLAKLVGQSKLTAVDATMGTVSYMSPEQSQGEAVDLRTDIWSLGVVLFEMLTGEMPFKGEYDAAIIYSILREEPAAISDLRAGIPPELEMIVNKCLEKKPADRYRNMDESLADLRRIRKKPAPDGNHSRRNVSVGSLQKRIWAGIVLSTLILAGIGYFSFFAEKDVITTRIPIAVVDFVNETQEDELNGLSGMLITALEQSQRLSVLTRSRMFDILKALQKPNVDRIDESLGREICREARVKAMVIASIRKFDQLYAIDLKVIDPGKDEHLFATAEKGQGKASVPAMIDRLAEKTREGLKVQVANPEPTGPAVAQITTTNLEAYQHFFLGEQLANKLKFAEAAVEFRKAVELDTTFGLAYYRLAYAMMWRSESEQLTKEPLQKALALLDRIPEKERYLVLAEKAGMESGREAKLAVLKEAEKRYPDDKEVLFEIGECSFHMWPNPEAREYFEKVVGMDSTFERAVNHLALTYQSLGQFEKMVTMAKRYVTISPSEESFLLLGEAYIRTGSFDLAANALQRAGEFAPGSWSVSRSIADLHIIKGEYDKAEAELKARLTETQSPGVRFAACRSLAYFYPYLGKYRESLGYYDKLIEFSRQANDTLRAALFHIFKGYTWLGGWRDEVNARREAKRALHFRETLKTNNPYLIQLSILHAALGDFAFADSVAGSALLSQPQALYFSVQSYFLSRKHECAEAERLFEEARKIGLPMGPSIWVRINLAECHFTSGQLEQAMMHLENLQKINYNDFLNRSLMYPRSLYLMGRIHEQRGEQKNAVRYYRKIVELWQDGDEDLTDLIDAKKRLAGLTQ